MALHEAAHHVGFARGPEGRTDFLCLLYRDETIDDVAALHQQPMHLLIDGIDFAAQVLQ